MDKKVEFPDHFQLMIQLIMSQSTDYTQFIFAFNAINDHNTTAHINIKYKNCHSNSTSKA